MAVSWVASARENQSVKRWLQFEWIIASRRSGQFVLRLGSNWRYREINREDEFHAGKQRAGLAAAVFRDNVAPEPDLESAIHCESVADQSECYLHYCNGIHSDQAVISKFLPFCVPFC